MSSPSFARRVAYNTVIQLIGRFLTSGTSLITVSLLNAGLLPERWGTYVALTAYLNFFATLADLGMNTLYLRELSRAPERAEEISGTFFGFRVVTALSMLGIAPLLALAVPAYHPYAELVAILALGQFFLVMNQLLVSIVQARLLMGWASLSDLVGRLTILAGSIAVIQYIPLQNRLLWLTAVVVVGSALNMIGTYLATRPLLKIHLQFSPQEWLPLTRAMIPMGAFVVFGLIHFKADSVILTLFQSKVDVGIYGNAYKVIEIYLLLPGMFVGSLFPAFTQASIHNVTRLKELFQKAFDLLLLGVVLLILFTVLASPYVIAVLTRFYVQDSARALTILSLTMIPWFLIYLTEYVLVAAGYPGKVGMIEGWAALLNILLNLLIIPHFSYIGAAYTTFISETFVLITVGIFFWRMFKFLPKVTVLLPILLGVGVAGGITEFLFAYYPNLLSWFIHLHRVEETGLLIIGFATFIVLYTAPSYCFGILPAVVQERLPTWRKS